MPALSRLHFDERNRKYSHLCCHIRIAALVIGCLQLITFVYDLGNFAAYSMQLKFGGGGGGDGGGSSSIYSKDTIATVVSDTNDEDEYQWVRQKGIIVGLVWDSLVSLSVLLTLYGIRRVQPMYLVPQLIMYAATVAICLILAIIVTVVAFRGSYFDQLWIYILIVVGAGFLYTYFFLVIVRTFRYLTDKRRFLNDTTNIYIVPIGSGIDALPHDPYDVPPAYPGLLSGSKSSDAVNNGDDKLPSYEEAQTLQPKEQTTEENRV